MKRIALYLRVSTSDQTTDPQRAELLEYCKNRKWEDVTVFADTISGAKWTRTGLDAMMKAIRHRAIDAVLVVKLDRLGRTLNHLAQMVAEFDTNKVALICPSQGIDTSTDNPAGRVQLHVLMAISEFERSLISDRTKAGLANARAKGKTLGRPKFQLTPMKQAMVRKAMAGELTFKELAAELGCSIGKAHALVVAAEKEEDRKLVKIGKGIRQAAGKGGD